MDERTPEGFTQDVIDERVEVLLEAWGLTEDDRDDDRGYYEYRESRAYELAVSFPSEIATDLFAEFVAEGLVA